MSELPTQEARATTNTALEEEVCYLRGERVRIAESHAAEVADLLRVNLTVQQAYEAAVKTCTVERERAEKAEALVIRLKEIGENLGSCLNFDKAQIASLSESVRALREALERMGCACRPEIVSEGQSFYQCLRCKVLSSPAVANTKAGPHE